MKRETEDGDENAVNNESLIHELMNVIESRRIINNAEIISSIRTFLSINSRPGLLSATSIELSRLSAPMRS